MTHPFGSSQSNTSSACLWFKVRPTASFMYRTRPTCKLKILRGHITQGSPVRLFKSF
ncbi:unnamed protein product [Rodentolepis nana]|uniref:Uncharacterized protein n=1 Tax=Rodentolepis nana TaxID=102285 RepID=A0A0R3TBI3_RODNA|nr:unnamed protein product [Rodentolepis nana]